MAEQQQGQQINIELGEKEAGGFIRISRSSHTHPPSSSSISRGSFRASEGESACTDHHDCAAAKLLLRALEDNSGSSK